MTPEKPRKENICAVIVAFCPDVMFSARVASIAPQVKHILIVDNSDSPATSNPLKAVASKLHLDLIQNIANLGIAKALNQGMCWAAERGYRWTLFLDQDSVVAENMIDSLVEAYSAFPMKENLAMIGSNFEDPSIQTQVLGLNQSKSACWEETRTAITSGSLLFVDAYKAIGPFRDEFFIDCVDLEYCLRARSLGFKVILTRKPIMQHQIGRMTMHRLLWRVTGTSNHPPVRRYFMARNRIVLMREYLFTEPIWAIKTVYSHLKSTALCCLFEQSKWQKLKYTGLGVFDGFSSNYSRRVS
jgi:rhamnosyltransferase